MRLAATASSRWSPTVQARVDAAHLVEERALDRGQPRCRRRARARSAPSCSRLSADPGCGRRLSPRSAAAAPAGPTRRSRCRRSRPRPATAARPASHRPVLGQRRRPLCSRMRCSTQSRSARPATYQCRDATRSPLAPRLPPRPASRADPVLTGRTTHGGVSPSGVGTVLRRDRPGSDGVLPGRRSPLPTTVHLCGEARACSAPVAVIWAAAPAVDDVAARMAPIRRISAPYVRRLSREGGI